MLHVWEWLLYTARWSQVQVAVARDAGGDFSLFVLVSPQSSISRVAVKTLKAFLRLS